MLKATTLAGVAAVLLGPPGVAHATPNLVVNGGFERSSYTQSHQFGTHYGGQGVTGWAGSDGYNLYFFGATATTASADTELHGSSEKLWPRQGASTAGVASPTGGNFVALDGDSTYRPGESTGHRSWIDQTVNGLQVGAQYLLEFDWGAGQLQTTSGPTTERLQVSLGGQSFTTGVVGNPSRSFTGWFHEAFTFTPAAATETLRFLSVGTPGGDPPIAVLDNVSLTQVPEPASAAVLGAGLLGLLARRRRRPRA